MPEPLTRERTLEVIEEMRTLIAKVSGVSVVEDHNGAFGQLGSTYLTLRFRSHGQDVAVMMVVQNVTDLRVEEYARFDRECPK